MGIEKLAKMSPSSSFTTTEENISESLVSDTTTLTDIEEQPKSSIRTNIGTQRQLLTLKQQPSSHSIIQASNKDSKISPMVSTPPTTSSSLPPLIYNTGVPANGGALINKQVASQGVTAPILNLEQQMVNSPPNEFLKVDFVAGADKWFSYVGNANKGKAFLFTDYKLS